MRSLKSFITCSHGISFVEFALILPVLMLFLFGTIEVARYAIINQKLDKAANAMADFATQGSNIRSVDLDTYASSLDQIMHPFTFSGTVIFTSIVHYDNGVPPCTDSNVICISWQATRLGGDNSQIGAVGGSPSLPDGYIVDAGQNVIAAEVYLNYSPMLAVTGTLIPPLVDHKMYKVVVYKPRQRNLGVLSN
jgi:hypothetical protein